MNSLEYAMKILGVRPHASSELFKKLQKKDFTIQEINQAMVDCERYGFINDELFAKDYAQLLNSKGYGRYVIIKKLKMLKISDTFINSALELITDEFSEAEKAFNYKLRLLKNEKDIRKKREKLYRFMLTRGFQSEIINKLLLKLSL